MSDDRDYDRRAQAEIAAIRSRAECCSFSNSDLTDAIMDRLALLARLDALEADRDAIAQAAESAVTALNAAVQRLAEQRDSAHELLGDIRIYLETRPIRTPMIERLITAIVAQLGPSAARIDELP